MRSSSSQKWTGYIPYFLASQLKIPLGAGKCTNWSQMNLLDFLWQRLMPISMLFILVFVYQGKSMRLYECISKAFK